MDVYCIFILQWFYLIRQIVLTLYISLSIILTYLSVDIYTSNIPLSLIFLQMLQKLVAPQTHY